ncbi:hypothetical protein LTR85_011255 [Meristemomyces frigidus]|nr:hypothetical protein LTR85_011255 [Meristemomyces frigidus]
MPPLTDLDAVGQLYEMQLAAAWELFETEQFAEANAIALRFLQEPDISDLHAAGFHLILAHSPDQYVEHAERAVDLYRGLYDGAMAVDDTNGPSARQLTSKISLIKAAEIVLRKARADAEKYPAPAYDQAAISAEIQALEEREAEEAEAQAAEEARAAEGLEMEEQDMNGAGTGEGGDGGTPPESQTQVPELVLSQAEDDVAGGDGGEDEEEFPDLPTPPPSRGNQ